MSVIKGTTLLLILSLHVAGSQSKCSDNCGDVNASTLKLVFFLFRHGARTPTATYPTDPWANYWQSLGGLGQLFPTGIEMHYKFGQWARKCYGSFLSENYKRSDVYVRSTDYDRTLMSAETHLAGVYPPRGSQVWSGNKDVRVSRLWQPIPIYSMPKAQDNLRRAWVSCAAYLKLVADRWANLPLFQFIRENQQDLLDYIATNAGLPLPGDLRQISENVADTIFITHFNGLALPAWVNASIYARLDKWKDNFILTEQGNDTCIRLVAGQLIGQIQDLLQNKSRGLVSEKHIIFSGHDSNVASLLGAYGHFYRTAPPYASAIITELHFDPVSQRHFVKAFYRKYADSDPIPLSIRDCGEPCYLENYITTLNPLRVDDPSIACAVN